MVCTKCMVERASFSQNETYTTINNNHQHHNLSSSYDQDDDAFFDGCSRSTDNCGRHRCRRRLPKSLRKKCRQVFLDNIQFHALIFAIFKYNNKQHKYLTYSHKSLKRLRYLNCLNSKQKPR